MKTKITFLKNKKRMMGFTLIELLVVVAIISLLSSVVLASLNSARQKAKITRAKEDMYQIKTAMEMYLGDNGLLPPGVDSCSACANPCGSWWTSVIDPLVSGKYLGARIDKDPWGNYYCYDNNYKIPDCSLDTPLWSMGPNSNRDSSWSNTTPTTFAGDDFGIIIEPPQC